MILHWVHVQVVHAADEASISSWLISSSTVFADGAAMMLQVFNVLAGNPTFTTGITPDFIDASLMASLID